MISCKYCEKKLAVDETVCSHCGGLVIEEKRPSDEELYQENLNVMNDLERQTCSLYVPSLNTAFLSSMKILIFIFSGIFVATLFYSLGLFDDLLFWFGG